MSSDVFAAFEAAVEYFHAHLDHEIAEHTGNCSHPECGDEECDRPSTAREYFVEHRGWDDATLEEWKLGYAPSFTGLADHLREEGFGEETIRSTGLFTKNTKSLWRGRYVLPYFGESGDPIYAIARTTGSKGGGAAGYDGHSEDFLAGKYAKVAHTKDYVPLDEPIFGLSTVEESEDVVIAEGIADAITAAEAGYSVLSPVTTQFKREHFDQLLEIVGGDEEREVFVIPDNERAGFSRIDSDDVPEEPEHIYEAVNIPKVSPGIGGGLRTANHLRENGVDAHLVELPRGGLDKVDLDDYLHGWADTLESPLASAKPPNQHGQFTRATEGQVLDRDPDRDTGSVPERSTDSDLSAFRTDGMSALWGLSLEEVNPELHEGYRGKNPLSHQGSSENYFHVFRPSSGGDLLAMDYKRGVKYCGVTYLLVEIGVRDPATPEGPLSHEETWKAWSEARKRGILGPEDTIPQAALWHVAEDRDLYDFSALPEDAEELPAKAHNYALNWVENTWWDAEKWGGDEDEEATSRRGKKKDAASAKTWEDVRYIYEDSNSAGRQAAEEVLRRHYHFMAVEGRDDGLHVYDEETGRYTSKVWEVRAEIHDELGEKWSTHELNEILSRLRQQNVVEPRNLNARNQFDAPHICVKNGVLNLFTEELLDHSPEYNFVDRVPVTYDESADTEPYEETLDDWTRREEDAKAMMEMVGHALVPDAHERSYKKFLILYGNTNNGKSVFYRRVMDLLEGPDSEENNIANVKLGKLSENRFSMNSIYGSMANIAGEINGKKIRNTAQIKDITGGDGVEIEPKGSKSFFDTVNTTLMFAANDPPIIGERDKGAIATRIVPIELPYEFVENPTGPMEKKSVPEKELEEQLATEEALSGFLNLALDGIQRLEENSGDVSLPESPMERLKNYEKQADPMKEFAHECLANGDNEYLVKDDVTTIYKEFASSNDYEIGMNVHSTLHSVLQGMKDLNYADSRPRSPDYSTTSLPMRGWDERKTVVNRVTLTDEGLEYARAAGLVLDETEDTAPTAETLADVEPGHQPSLTATLGGQLEPAPWLEEEGWLEDGTGFTLDYRVREGRGTKNPMAGTSSGDTVEFENVAVKTDDDGLRYIEITPKSTVTVVDSPNSPSPEDGGPSAEATTDGGVEDPDTSEDGEPSEEAVQEALVNTPVPDDAVDAGADARRLAEHVGSRILSKQQIQTECVDEFDWDMKRTEKLIEKALKEGLLSEPQEDKYRQV